MKVKKMKDYSKELKNEGGIKDMTANWLWTAEDGISNFAMRLMEFAPGGHTSFHSHLEEHQFYFVEGEPTIVDKNGIEIKLESGDTAYLAPNEPHQVKNLGTTTLKMICIIPIFPGCDGKTTTQST